jgi:hypothetical protein
MADEQKVYATSLDTAQEGQYLTAEQMRELGRRGQEEGVEIARRTASTEETPEDVPKEDKARTRKYQYPLSGLDTAPARITFAAYKIEPFFPLDEVSSNEQAQQEEEEQQAVAEDEEYTSLLTDIKNVAGAVGGFLKSYKNESGGTRLGSVTLPLQKSLTFADGVTYNEAELGVIGALPDAGEISMDNGRLTGAAKALGSQLAAKAAGLALGTGVGAAAAQGPGFLAGAIGGNAIGDQAAAAAKAASRVSVAPNQRTQFDRVNLRSFNFTFKMIARNRPEQQQIKNIVQFFREELYPEAIRITDDGLPFAYEFPNVFDIRIENKSKKEPAPKIQRCYLESVQTVYNATASGMYDGEEFVEVDIALSFKEITALDKAKVRDQGY